MKIVAISDTHGQHENVRLPSGEVLIHSGDCTRRGTLKEAEEFLEWMDRLDFKHKVFVAGNHDFIFEKLDEDGLRQLIPDSITYLNDSGIEIEGRYFWGSPVQPWFHNWAFNRQRGEEIRKHWDLIPVQTDVLITHGPVYGVHDECVRGERVGCKDLRDTVLKIKPQLYICGHIHEAYGEDIIDNVHYVNASLLDEYYEMVNKPIVVEVS